MMMQKMMKNKPVAAVLAAGIFWGFMGMFARKLNAAGFTAMEVAQVRVTTGLILVGTYLLIFNRKAFKVRLKDLWCFIGTGIISLFFFSVCYFSAINLTSLSIACVLLYTAPVFVMLISLILFKEKISLQKVTGLIMAFVGCVLVCGLGSEGPILWKGILLGLGSGFFYSLYSIFGRYAINRGYGAWTMTFYTFLFCALCTTFLSDWGLMYTAVKSDSNLIIWSCALGFITAFFPYVLYSYGLEHMESGKASILASIEPVVSTVCGYFFFDEKIGITGFIGIVLVLGAITILNINFKKKNI